MQPAHVLHFEEEGRLHPCTAVDRMPEAAYSTALDYLVITCVDIAFLHRQQILLARRNKYPRKSWWLIGGRMVAGESPIATAHRKAREEAHLDLAADRFEYLGAYSTCFALRQQAPIHNGLHSVNLTYQIELTPLEKKQLVLKPEEYDPDWQWLDLEQVEQFIPAHQIFDRALLTIVQELRSRSR